MIDPQATARLNTAVGWRQWIFQGTSRDYLGNAVAIPFAQLPVGEVIDAAYPLPNGYARVTDKLLYVACCIQQDITPVGKKTRCGAHISHGRLQK